jgi:hypothetical protein
MSDEQTPAPGDPPATTQDKAMMAVFHILQENFDCFIILTRYSEENLKTSIMKKLYYGQHAEVRGMIEIARDEMRLPPSPTSPFLPQ